MKIMMMVGFMLANLADSLYRIRSQRTIKASQKIRDNQLLPAAYIFPCLWLMLPPKQELTNKVRFCRTDSFAFNCSARKILTLGWVLYRTSTQRVNIKQRDSIKKGILDMERNEMWLLCKMMILIMIKIKIQLSIEY